MNGISRIQTTRRIVRLLVLVALMAATIASPRPARAATIYRVAPGGLTAGACGIDFTTNACDLQYAVGLAAATDQLWILQGTYRPTDEL